ncbi:hypothetical protein H0H81_000330 [Sphagnurus paluster]|uniref:Uncharacterized protein n=1 Tax=Sphagnurus paluster TaxID=117069 RepID=A0A9P7FU69_9AGAR|nr:hypothetical protein H0H81_000330 [Sphagnurus paluster]
MIMKREIAVERKCMEEQSKDMQRTLQKHTVEQNRAMEEKRIVETWISRSKNEVEEKEQKMKNGWESLEREQAKLKMDRVSIGERAARGRKESSGGEDRKRKKACTRSGAGPSTTLNSGHKRRTQKVLIRDHVYDDQFWHNDTALERFLLVIEIFEKVTFSKELQPLTIGSVPWPVLERSVLSSNSDELKVTWDDVDEFFAYVKSEYRSAEEYKKLVVRVHRMFHPDRWCSRRLLDSVQDLTVRKMLDDYGNAVAQAITSIWILTK